MNAKIKNFFTGFVAALCLTFTIASTQNTNPNEAIGKYQVAVSNDEIVILNTATGEYIVHFDGAIVGNVKARFRKSSFDKKLQEAREH